MGTLVTHIWVKDDRIDALLKERNVSRALAIYLRDALAANQGTYIVAALILDALAPFLACEVPVIQADVERLGVHNGSDEAMERVMLALGKDEFPRHARDLAVHLRTNLPPEEIIRGVEYPPRPGVSDDPEVYLTYLRIFICAAAMASGVEVDPRRSAA